MVENPGSAAERAFSRAMAKIRVSAECHSVECHCTEALILAQWTLAALQNNFAYLRRKESLKTGQTGFSAP